jgi:Fe-S-cluster containining protein
MRCSHCGKCCEKTEMLLSRADIELLERAGYTGENFVRYDRHGFARLRNRKGYCVFYDVERRHCKVYRHRPLGCRIYPIIYSEEERIIVDYLCPVKNTISNNEIKRKGKNLIKLLQRIDNEAKTRFLHKTSK